MLHIVSLSPCTGIYEFKIVKCKILNHIEITSQTHYVCILLPSRCHILLRLRFVYAVSIKLRHMILGLI
jgi:hypothetical protein